MRQDILSILCCPTCHHKGLTLSIKQSSIVEVRHGSLSCQGCTQVYPIHEGIPDFRGNLDKKVLREISQWEVFAETEGWLNPPEEYLDALPSPKALQFCPRDTITWVAHEKNFEVALKGVDLKNKVVLDIGAGRCWSTKIITLRGANAIALDVMPHPRIGLGAADVLMERNRIFFERLAADMNKIPLQNGVVDIVLVSGSLHHSVDLKASAREFARVLRPGGSLILTNEACSGYFSVEQSKLPEAQEGINEHQYRTRKYIGYLRSSGFLDFEPLPHAGFTDRTINPAYFPGKVISRLCSQYPSLYYYYLLLRGGVMILRARKAQGVTSST